MLNTTALNSDICPKCGQKLILDQSKILTSYPPKYLYYCPNCDYVTYSESSLIVNTPSIPYGCEHDFKVEVVNGDLVSVCRRCGKIGDRKEYNTKFVTY